MILTTVEMKLNAGFVISSPDFRNFGRGAGFLKRRIRSFAREVKKSVPKPVLRLAAHFLFRGIKGLAPVASLGARAVSLAAREASLAAREALLVAREASLARGLALVSAGP